MPVISVGGTRVLLTMSPPGVLWRRHGDTGRDPGVTWRRDSAREAALPEDAQHSGWAGRRRPPVALLGLPALRPTAGRRRPATPQVHGRGPEHVPLVGRSELHKRPWAKAAGLRTPD